MTSISKYFKAHTSTLIGIKLNSLPNPFKRIKDPFFSPRLRLVLIRVISIIIRPCVEYGCLILLFYTIRLIIQLLSVALGGKIEG